MARTRGVQTNMLQAPSVSLPPRAAVAWPTDAPTLTRGPLAIVEALLKSPASIVLALRGGDAVLARLSGTIAVSLAVVGLVVASFSGGLQFFLVPLKLALGIFFCALICLPSLHVFSCLSGATQSLKETWSALLMGVALTSLLLVGFAPIAWIFSQATTSVAFMGALHLVFLVISCVFGLALVNRTLTAMNASRMRWLRVWSALFLLVVFQMTTTLRPLVGAASGVGLHGRLFFFSHWLAALAG